MDVIGDHFIICGYGRVGRRVAHELCKATKPYVVLDSNPAALAVALERGDLFVDGRGTSDDDLRAAGIERARGLIACADSDLVNVYTTVSARSLRPELQIVARASSEEASNKLLLAGANRVIDPYSTAGTQMAKLALEPPAFASPDPLSPHGGHSSAVKSSPSQQRPGSAE
jgi:voltage-gated potassium channel